MAADTERDRRISTVVEQQASRLRRFIERRVRDRRDAEDILQDVFYELVEANRRLMPIDHVTGWLFQVARNRITDLFRRKQPEPFDARGGPDEGDAAQGIEDLLPSPDEGPEAALVRRQLLEELEDAIADLPDEQRQVFVAHEIDGRAFKDMAAEWGVSLNTLLSRKRYAVLRLRERLQQAHDDLGRA